VYLVPIQLLQLAVIFRSAKWWEDLIGKLDERRNEE